jgi:hypothetical protein
MSEPGHSRQRVKDSADVDGGAKGRAGRPATVATPGPRRTQLILVGLLLALVIAGVRAGPALRWTRRWTGPWHDRGSAIGLSLELVFAALLIALWVLRRRSPDPGWPAARLRATLPPLIILAMIALGVSLIHVHFSPAKRRIARPPAVNFGHKPKTFTFKAPPLRGAATDVAIAEYVLLALAVLAVIAAFVTLLRRRRHSPDATADLSPEDDEGAALRTAVQAGRTALTALTEARKAIIACYLAMERSLGEAGTARGEAETPDELLARASAAGLLRGDAAAILTGLFYEARFSSRAVQPGARQTALRALDAISADLRATGKARPQDRAGSAAAP